MCRTIIPAAKRTLRRSSTVRAYFRSFVAWYNDDHHHSGLALMTPADVHRGRIEERRFVRGTPSVLELQPIGYINRPEDSEAA